MADISKINLPNGDEYGFNANTLNGLSASALLNTNILKRGKTPASDDNIFGKNYIGVFNAGEGIVLDETDATNITFPDEETYTVDSLVFSKKEYDLTSNSSSQTGYILIKITSNQAWMTSFTINLYQSYVATKIEVHGYQYGDNYWYSPGAELISDSNGDTYKNVYFGYTSAKNLWVAVDAKRYTGCMITDVAVGNKEFGSAVNNNRFDISRVATLPGTTQTTVKAVNHSIINLIYPIGSIYMSVTNSNPNTWLIGTTWVAWGKGRVPVGMGSNGTTNYTTVEETGGKESVKLTAAESGVPQHTHALSALTLRKSTIGSTQYGFATGDTFKGDIVVGQNTGKSTTDAFVSGTAGNNTAKAATDAHENRQPYITCYMWKRTA